MLSRSDYRVKYTDNTGAATWIKRSFTHSATGAILQSNYKAWLASVPEPAGTDAYHSWGKDGRAIQNWDGSTGYGGVWHWAGAQNSGSGPLRSPNADTPQQAYNIDAKGGAGTPQRKTFVDPTTPGDSRNMWGQGMPNPADSVAFWKEGQSATAVAGGGSMTMNSRIQYAGSVSVNLDIATDAREKGRMSFYGSGYSFYGSSPRLTSETIGRDINPLGRGDGMAYVGGMVNLGRITPSLPMNQARVGMGNSVNNELTCPGCPGGGGGKNPAFNDCGDAKLPGCCCNVVAADTYGLFAGGHCSYDGVKAACEDTNCRDPKACQDAKCDYVDCLKRNNMQFCTSCDCGGVGSGTGSIPPCPGCGGGAAGDVSGPPIKGDIFHVNIGLAPPSGGGGGGIGGFSGGSFKPGSGIWDFGSIMILPIIIGVLIGVVILLALAILELVVMQHQMNNAVCPCDHPGIPIAQYRLLDCLYAALMDTLPGPGDAWEDFWEDLSPDVPAPFANLDKPASYFGKKLDCCDFFYEHIVSLCKCGWEDACECIPPCKYLGKCATGGLGRGMSDMGEPPLL